MSKAMRHRRRKKNRMATFMAFVVCLLAVAALVSMLFMGGNVKKELRVEAGTAKVLATSFLKKGEGKTAYFVDNMDKVDLWTPGEYTVLLGYEGKQHAVKLIVEDTIKPSGFAKHMTVYQGQKLKAEDFITDINDATAVKALYKTEPDFFRAGDQPVTVLLVDAAGNTNELTTTLTVEEDTEAPTIYGVTDLTAYAGGTLSYKKNIYIKDDKDPAPRLSVDSSDVDLSKAGEYTVRYIATDLAGNENTVAAKVTVHEKSASFVDEDTIDEEVQKVIDKIIKDEMTKKEQVKAIYNWARNNFAYVSKFDKTDWKQSGYTMLTKKGGDCFGYFAVTKLLFEELGIDNIDVHKVKNYEGDSSHYWSLVSLDDGETWYHFDATPRVGTGDDFCLVTDAFLDNYSEKHKNSHNRDKSLYPATPEA